MDQRKFAVVTTAAVSYVNRADDVKMDVIDMKEDQDDDLHIENLTSCADLLRELHTSAYLELTPGRAYTRGNPRYLDVEANSATENAALSEIFANRECQAKPVRAFRLNDAFVFGQGSVVTRKECLVTDSAAEFLNHRLVPDGAISRDDILIVRGRLGRERILGSSLLVKRPWYRNYGHWLVDLAPLLALVAHADLSIDSLIFGDVPQGPLRQTMIAMATSLFKDAKIIFMSDDQLVSCDELIYVEPVHIPPLYKSPIALDAMIQASYEVFGSVSSEYGDKVYISRRKSGGRNIINEDQVAEALMHWGYSIVYPEELPFVNQIALFRHAKSIIGVKGAAMTTCAFSQRGSDLLLLSPAGFLDPFFWDLVSPRGISYSEIFCPAEVGDSISMRDMEVSLQLVRRYLCELRGSYN